MPRALISVSDKRGIVPFAQGLVDLGWDIISTGGTHAALKAGGVPVQPVDKITGFPEILDGRVKTLHPAIHAGLLARRDMTQHTAALATHRITPIDLLAVNLYPFRETVAKPQVSFEDAIENIDVGGPAMLRSAAKNHESVIVVVDPTDYGRVLDLLRRGEVPRAVRQEFAAKVFSHTADYDGAIARYLTPREDGMPHRIGWSFERLMSLRYGENPTQRAALYVDEEPRGLRDLKQRQGKELSFNNILDLDAGMWAVSLWHNVPACAIIKHTTPCGMAIASTAEEAFKKALASDPKSAFGGVVAFNTVVDRVSAEAITQLFIEVVVAPSFHDEALAVLASKPEFARRRAAGLAGRHGPRLQAGARRHAAPGSLRLRVGRVRVEVSHRASSHRGGDGGPALRLGRGGGGQVQRGAPRPQRDDDRDRRRTDEPGGQLVPGGAQGSATGPRPARAPFWHPMRSSRSPTALTRPRRRVLRRSSSPVARCATRKSSPRPTSTGSRWC